ncbi:MAG TPA: hypothetical protein VFB24_14725 [Candidatus Binatia bacterium]|nr:hypothetical protein [Candidatus Binatia bacterium]
MSRDSGKTQRVLTFLPLVAATYFMVAGGPYGLEELVAKTRVKEPDLLRPFQMLGLGPMLLVALGFYRGEFLSAAGDDYLVSALGGLVVLGPLIYAWTFRRSRAQAAASLVE